MCNRSDRQCWFLWSLAISVVVAIVVVIAIRHNKYLLEKKQDEKDAEIKEFGC